MDLYYGQPSEGNIIILDEDESKHLINVKRGLESDIVYVTDGKGKLFVTEIQSRDKRNCTLSILETKTSIKRKPSLHIAIAPTKNIERIEWFLEKVTEIGIDEVSFILCRHSERKEIKIERLNRVLVAAMKQSLKTFLPKLNPMIDFKKMIPNDSHNDRMICSLTDETKSFKEIYSEGKSLLALIGPEGDFHQDELLLAKENGFKTVSLGEERLRTETAGVTICSFFSFVNS
jgi:16S rRNA (uracil1498-N3)-methyltransferase